SAVTSILHQVGVTLPDGISIPATGAKSADLSFMTIGAADVHAFVGMGGPYFIPDPTNPNNVIAPMSSKAVGLVINDFDFGLAIMRPTDPLDFEKYFALEATANNVSLVGIDGVTATANDLNVEVNESSPSLYGAALFPAVDFAHTFASEELPLF